MGLVVRPTTRDLAEAIEDLKLIAYAHDPNGSPRFNSGFHDVAAFLNEIAWLISEIKAAEGGAAYGKGVEGGYHVLHRGGEPTDVSSRGQDPHAKNLRNLLAGWNVENGRIVDTRRQEAMDIGRYPTPSEQDDWQRKLMGQAKPPTRSEQAV
jgi:hypothetical protein